MFIKELFAREDRERVRFRLKTAKQHVHPMINNRSVTSGNSRRKTL
jgi:hypothetical protein